MNFSSNKVPSSSMRYRGRIMLGSVIRLNQKIDSAYRGEHGVCYEVFQTIEGGEILEGYSFIFEKGHCTSLIPDEIDDKILLTGRVSQSHQYRWFTYLTDVVQHWEEGGFDEAFNPSPKLRLIT